MKKFRLIILTALVIVSLAAAVMPALALHDTLNWTFMGDKNGDNIPDKWNVKGDVVRTCTHGYDAATPCAMVFLPSNHGAALWQIIDIPDMLTTEEGYTDIAYAIAAAKQMDWDRAFIGFRFFYADGTQIVVYDDFPGGTYPFTDLAFYSYVGAWAGHFEYDLQNGNIDQVKWGILALPHNGYLAVDVVEPD